MGHGVSGSIPDHSTENVPSGVTHHSTAPLHHSSTAMGSIFVAIVLLPCGVLSLHGGAWELVTRHAAFHERDSAQSWVHDGKLWFGGGWFNSFGEPPRDVWSADATGRNWTRATTKAAWDHADFAAMATLNGRMLHIGGWRGGRLANATASARVFASTDGAQWDLLADPAPFPSREGAAALTFGGRVWLLGGATQYYFAANATGAQLLSDVWSSADGATWSCATTAAGWAPRAYHAAVAFGGRMFVLGGGNYQSGGGTGTGEPLVGYRAYNDVWASADGKRWGKVVASAPWTPRIWFGAAVYRGCMWVLGGWAAPNGYNASRGVNYNANDVWTSADGKNWERSGDPAWNGRHAPSVQVLGDRIWLMAGNNWGNYSHGIHGTVNEVWSLQLP